MQTYPGNPVTAEQREPGIVEILGYRQSAEDFTQATGTAVEATVYAHPYNPGAYNDMADQPNEHTVALHSVVDVIVPHFRADGHIPGIVLRCKSAEAARRLSAALSRAAELLAARSSLGELRNEADEEEPWLLYWPTTVEPF